MGTLELSGDVGTQVNNIMRVREDPVVMLGVVSGKQTQAQLDKRLVMGTSSASRECHDKNERLLAVMAGGAQIKDHLIVHGQGEEKCTLGKQEVVWSDHVFNKQGMSSDPEQVKTIRRWPAPKDKSEVKSFLQTCQFSRKSWGNVQRCY